MTHAAVAVPHSPKLRHRPLLAIGAILLGAWASFVGYIDWAMHQSPETFGRVMMHVPMPAYFLFPFETMWTHARHGSLYLNTPAPDFDLELYDKSGRVQLSSFRGKQPVVLVFGSYT
jgi:hypothetical protein